MPGLSFTELFNRSGFENQFPVLVWVVLVELIGLAASPLAFKVLGNLPDKGYGLAKPLGILLLAWVTWLLASVGLLPNTRTTIALVLLLEIALGLAIVAWERQAILKFWRARRGLILISELVFWSAFGLFLVIRMANPDLWHPFRGGEKPMDIAFLMATLKSPQFPPYDPWFAGGTINYYYFGQVIVATLIKLAAIVPTTAYNLAVPLLFALLAGSVFSVTYAVVARAEETGLNRNAVLGGLCAVLFAQLLGNLAGAIQLINQIAYIGAASNRAAAIVPGYLGWFVNGVWLVVTHSQALVIPTDWYWDPTRVLQGTINEFPFFTFLYADLHAHMIAMPFTVLALAFALQVVKSGDRISPWSLLLAAPVLGSLYVTNSWDFPTYVLAFGLALVIPWYRDRLGDWRNLAWRVVVGLIVVGLAFVAYLPFHLHFVSYYFGVDPFPDKSDIGGFLVIHGLFLFVLVSFLAVDLLKRYGDAAVLRTLALALDSPGRVERMVRLHRRLVKHTGLAWLAGAYGVALAVVFLVALLVANLNVVALLAAVLLATVLLIAKRKRPAEELFVLAIVAVGLMLGIFVEFFAIKGDVGRMNTVFKFYLQIWILWSIAAGFAIQRMLGRGHREDRDAIRSTMRRPTGLGRLAADGAGVVATAIGSVARRRSSLGSLTAKRTWASIMCLLIVSAAAYPLVGTRARVADRFDNNIQPTLDGTAYMRTAIYHDQKGDMILDHDLKAITWLQDNVAGAPVILEGWTPFYRWGARISIYTGLPTVIGWDWHEKQQRWGYQSVVDKRIADVNTMYSTTSPEQAMALLAEYRVSYVYVGDLERVYYPRSGLQKFDMMVGKYLNVVYDSSGVKIYKIKG